MHQRPERGLIRPKVSTMPRQKSEASAYLDIYKLAVEKRRLQQELQALDQRRQRICQRLGSLRQEIAMLEGNVHELRGSGDAKIGEELIQPISTPISGANQTTTQGDTFKSITLDY